MVPLSAPRPQPAPTQVDAYNCVDWWLGHLVAQPRTCPRDQRTRRMVKRKTGHTTAAKICFFFAILTTLIAFNRLMAGGFPADDAERAGYITGVLVFPVVFYTASAA